MNCQNRIINVFRPNYNEHPAQEAAYGPVQKLSPLTVAGRWYQPDQRFKVGGVVTHQLDSGCACLVSQGAIDMANESETQIQLTIFHPATTFAYQQIQAFGLEQMMAGNHLANPVPALHADNQANAAAPGWLARSYRAIVDNRHKWRLGVTPSTSPRRQKGNFRPDYLMDLCLVLHQVISPIAQFFWEQMAENVWVQIIGFIISIPVLLRSIRTAWRAWRE